MIRTSSDRNLHLLKQMKNSYVDRIYQCFIGLKQCLLLVVLFCSSLVSAQQAFSPDITVNDLKKHLYYLASDSLEGRFPGTKGSDEAANYIAGQLKSSNIQLFSQTGLQYFDVLTRQDPGKNNKIKVGSVIGKFKTDFVPFPFSSNGKIQGDLIFAGYGFDFKSDSLVWNDYRDLDVKGKIVMILRGTPDIPKIQNLLEPQSEDIMKAVTAKDKGAIGILFVSGKVFDPSDKLIEMNLKENATGIPVMQLKRSFANILLKDKKSKIEEIEEKIRSSRAILNFDVNTKVEAEAEIVKHKAQTANVIGFLYAADTSVYKSYVVIGAHYDHLGLGGPGSSSRVQDTMAVHNGADDNASGVSAVLELAGKLSTMRDKLRQNIVFVAFGAEEMGILGSKYFTEHPPVPLSNIKAMINLDMVGRLNEDTLLQVNGTGTSKEAVDMLNKLNAKYHFNLKMGSEGYGPSDYAAFYAKNIPVFSITSGAHMDYHTPWDDREKINYSGLKTICDFTLDLATLLSNSESPLTFQEAGPQQGSGGYRRFKVTLGIMPDVNGVSDKGLLVEFVTKGKPAYNGGMLKGDIITAINKMEVKNIQDYMVRLSKLKPGETIQVEVIRNNAPKLLIIQL